MIASDGLDIVLGKDSVYLFDVIGLEHDVSVVAVNRETVHILDIYSTVVDGAEKLLKTTYLVGDLNNGNVGEKRRKAVFAELFLALSGLSTIRRSRPNSVVSARLRERMLTSLFLSTPRTSQSLPVLFSINTVNCFANIVISFSIYINLRLSITWTALPSLRTRV